MNPLWLTVMVLLVACGEDNGNTDSILGGFSGVLIFGIIVWVVFRYVSKKGKT